jgi:uncharacterized membrane protein YphA (DoxX/SURF4 family)
VGRAASRRREEYCIVQRLFPGFPSGLPGVAILLLRLVLGACLLADVLTARGGPFPIVELDTSAVLTAWLLRVTLGVGGLLIAIGVFTPFVQALLAVGVVITLPGLPLDPLLQDAASQAQVLKLTIVITLALIGPGAYAVDAKLFGRREVRIPPAHKTRRLQLTRDKGVGRSRVSSEAMFTVTTDAHELSDGYSSRHIDHHTSE